MRWVAEWFNPLARRVIEADSLDEADNEAYRLLGKYPDSLYLETNDE